MLAALLPQEAPATLVAAHVRPKCAAACHGVLCADGRNAAANDACECVCNDELLLAGASVPQLLSVAPLRKLAGGVDSAQCQNLLEKESQKDWVRVNRPPDVDNLMNAQQTYAVTTAEGTKVIYVRNQKAGSTTVMEQLASALGGEKGGDWGKIVPYVWARSEAWPPESDNRTVVFTVVREPAVTAVDAYLEVSMRYTENFYNDDLEGIPGEHRWLHMNCTDPAARFSAFLDAVEARSALGRPAFHVFPQAVKTNIVSEREGIADFDSRGQVFHTRGRFDAVLKLEDLNSGMSSLGGIVGVNVTMPPSTEDGKHTLTKDVCADFQLTDYPDLMLRVCKIYHVDYVCFGYELPRVCRDLQRS